MIRKLIFIMALVCSYTTASAINIGDTLTYNVPEFYRADTIFHGDTAYLFRCYDKRDSLISDVTNYDLVRYYSLFQEYIDYKHTYKDADNTDKPLPVSIIVGRYDRLGTTDWMYIQYPGNKITTLRDDRSVIIRSDTLQEGNMVKIYRYYRSALRQ